MFDDVEVLSCVAKLGIKPPHMDPTLQKINAELREPDPCVQLVANYVAMDAGLANPVLGLVNSAGGGALVQIKNVGQAVKRMGLVGMRVLCNTITWITLNKDIKNVRKNKEFIDFLWEYNVRVATAAEMFARFCDFSAAFKERYPYFYDDLNTICLFSNSGALYISIKFAQEFEDSLRRAKGVRNDFSHDLPGTDSLDTNIPIDILLSAAFVKSWDADGYTVNTILAQNDPSQIPLDSHSKCVSEFVYILTMARYIVNTLYEGHRFESCVLHDSDETITEAREKLGVGVEKIQEFMCEVHMVEIREVLNKFLTAVK